MINVRNEKNEKKNKFFGVTSWLLFNLNIIDNRIMSMQLSLSIKFVNLIAVAKWYCLNSSNDKARRNIYFLWCQTSVNVSLSCPIRLIHPVFSNYI